jgi:hypothetical protein
MTQEELEKDLTEVLELLMTNPSMVIVGNTTTEVKLKDCDCDKRRIEKDA